MKLFNKSARDSDKSSVKQKIPSTKKWKLFKDHFRSINLTDENLLELLEGLKEKYDNLLLSTVKKKSKVIREILYSLQISISNRSATLESNIQGKCNILVADLLLEHNKRTLI